MCSATRKSLIGKKEVKNSLRMTSTQAADENRRGSYAEAYVKVKQITRQLFHTRKKGQHAPAL